MKKKTIAAFGFFAVSIVLIFLYTSAPANAQLLDQNFSVNTLASYLKNPQDVALYMWRHFDFERDQQQFGQEDYWQSADEILQSKKGDCEDFAVFAHEILKRNGQSAFIMNLYGAKPHSICVFKSNGLYGAVDGGNYIAAEFKDINSLLNYMDPFWKKAAITELNQNHRGRILKEITNSAKTHSGFLFWK